jgi:Holliday junction resolvase
MRMTINSKQKGARFERTLAAMFKQYGYTDAHRTAQYCGNTGAAADVVGLPGIHIEAKHQEQMRLYDWMAQAKRDAVEGNLPAVFHKKNNAAILVTMELPDFMKLYQEFEKRRD